MRSLNDKIKNGIANSYRLRELAKDDKLTQEKCFELNKMANDNDRKIMFYKKLANALKQTENEEKTQHIHK